MSIGHERDTQAFFFEPGTLPSTPDEESVATLDRAEADRRSTLLWMALRPSGVHFDDCAVDDDETGLD